MIHRASLRYSDIPCDLALTGPSRATASLSSSSISVPRYMIARFDLDRRTCRMHPPRCCRHPVLRSRVPRVQPPQSRCQAMTRPPSLHHDSVLLSTPPLARLSSTSHTPPSQHMPQHSVSKTQVRLGHLGYTGSARRFLVSTNITYTVPLTAIGEWARQCAQHALSVPSRHRTRHRAPVDSNLNNYGRFPSSPPPLDCSLHACLTSTEMALRKG